MRRSQSALNGSYWSAAAGSECRFVGHCCPSERQMRMSARVKSRRKIFARRAPHKREVRPLTEEPLLNRNINFDVDCDLCSFVIFSQSFISVSLARHRGLAQKGFEGFRPAR